MFFEVNTVDLLINFEITAISRTFEKVNNYFRQNINFGTPLKGLRSVRNFFRVGTVDYTYIHLHKSTNAETITATTLEKRPNKETKDIKIYV